MAALAGGEGILIHYSVDAMEEIRRLAVDGLHAFAHGGREIGGVLYGRREISAIHVLEAVELECEHALGPRFVLSEKDRVALADLMQPRNGLDPVGWFRAHTRSGLELDSHDRDLFGRHFEEPMTAALIIKPAKFGPALAAFYLRGAFGRDRSGSSSRVCGRASEAAGD